MEKKKRKYPIHSTVRIPDMDEIQNAASDFDEDAILDAADPSVKKSPKYPTVDSKPQFDAELSSIKKEMQKLAVVIANEELSKEVVEQEPDAQAEDSSGEANQTMEVQGASGPSDDLVENVADTGKKGKKLPPKK
jgi:hypothetical protein